MNSKQPQSEDSDDSLITPKRRSDPNYKPSVRKIYRARTRLIVCLWTLPVYVLTVWILLSNRQPIDMFMFFYFALCAGFWLDMAWRKCPACGKQFYVKSLLLNLVTHKCVHCSLDMAATEPVSDDKVEF
ncbi:MAG: hypothetical protein GKR91_17490 [Pseudomonadales bacterium]|nr:hypothetical protein [Pseudomonadales bacterium]